VDMGWQESAHLVVAGCVAFAAIGVGVSTLSSWRERVSAAHKLTKKSVYVYSDLETGLPGIGFELVNSANFPIDFTINHLWTQLGHFVPEHRNISGKALRIGAQGVYEYNAGAIRVDDVTVGQVVVGKLEVRLAYGRPGSTQMPLEIKSKVVVRFKENQEFESCSVDSW
jgi:hypothetical protein